MSIGNNKIKALLSHHSLFIKIISIVTIVLLVTMIAISTILITISDEVYIETYSHANYKIISQIKNDYYYLHEDIMEVLRICETSSSIKQYLEEESVKPQEETKIIYNLVSVLNDTGIIGINTASNLLLVGKNGKTFYQNDGGRVDDYREIWKSDVVKNAIEHKKEVVYQYAESGFTSDLKNCGVIHIIKILYDKNEIIGLADVMIKHSDFADIYDSLIDESNNNFYVVNDNGMVLSSSDKKSINTSIPIYRDTANKLFNEHKQMIRDYENGNNYTLLATKLPYNGLELISVIDESKFVTKINRLSTAFAVTFIILVFAILAVFFSIRKAMRPITRITDQMQYIINGDFMNPINVSGSGQVRELEETYNYMLEGLNRYIHELMKAQEEKRLSDIHALQMQINPHFIYNTLTSIKFLVWKGDKERATKIIDSFIQLLRMTIGNKNDILSLEEEIKNVENYIEIQKIRYGEKVQQRFYIDDATKHLLVPKMLIQPFIENSFLHAFEDKPNGIIDVYTRIKDEHLIIEIIDNGCGMESTELNKLLEKKDRKNQFSGIGIHNVDERIKLLYGKENGVTISSTLGSGTIVKIVLPKIRNQEELALLKRV